MSQTVTCGIPTRGRYNTLASTVLSIALQTLPPKEIMVVDDNDEAGRVDLRTDEHWNYILRLCYQNGIEFHHIFKPKDMPKGQHHSHELVQGSSKCDLIFRIDDDCVANPDVLRRLVGTLNKEKAAAVAPAVMIPPGVNKLPIGLRNTITSIRSGQNAQWYMGEGTSKAEHLYSCFLHQREAAHYDLNLSAVAHREETIFTHSIHRSGGKMFINHDAHVWHFQAGGGGIRSHGQDPSMWQHDEKIFDSYLNLWGIDLKEKVFVLDAGIGDTYCFKNILPEVREKYKGLKLIVATCWPDVFHDEDGLEIISIAQAINMYGHLGSFNVYGLMEQDRSIPSLTEGYRKMYL